MKFLYCALFFLMGSFQINAQSKDEKKILAILEVQTAAWNEGNIENFMQGYWNNDSLMFIGKSGITYGYNNTLENYKKAYPDKEQMGKLSFDILHVKKMCADRYFVVGKWMLERSVGNLEGHYTLIFRKIGGKWVIISDHSS